MQILDQWNDNLEPEQKTKVLRENFLTLDRAFQMTGQYILRNMNVLSAQSVTSTSYVATAFNMQVTSNGGLVNIAGSLAVAANTNTMYVQLVVDGQVKKTLFFGAAAAVNNMLSFVYMENMPAGSHSISLQAKVDGGTVVLGNTSVDSYIYVSEYVKG